MIGGADTERIIYEVLTAEPQRLTLRCGLGVDYGGSADVRRLWRWQRGQPGSRGF
jgi:hypothetical protein